MSRSIQNRLRKGKRRIERRLDGAREDRGKPMFQAANLRVELADKVRAIGTGGIGLVHRLACETGLVEAIDRRLHVLKIHRPYHESDHVLNLALSYRQQDRAKDALGHVHPEINEAKIVASYHQISRYHHLPLAQMQAAEALLAAGGEYAEAGRDFLRWASSDLKTYAERCYDPKTGQFKAMMTDGTPLRWQEARTGYYTPESFAPQKPDGFLLWGYAMAYRLTKDEAHWQMVRQLADQLGLGDLGGPDSEARSLDLAVDCDDWRVIYAMLELHQATNDDGFLNLACRVADNILKTQTPTGLFPRSGREYARTGDEAPLAILHLAATIQGGRSLIPPATFDRRFFHCEYHGPLEEHQKKRADSRTYDHLVYYGDS